MLASSELMQCHSEGPLAMPISAWMAIQQLLSQCEASLAARVVRPAVQFSQFPPSAPFQGHTGRLEEPLVARGDVSLLWLQEKRFGSFKILTVEPEVLVSAPLQLVLVESVGSSEEGSGSRDPSPPAPLLCFALEALLWALRVWQGLTPDWTLEPAWASALFRMLLACPTGRQVPVSLHLPRLLGEGRQRPGSWVSSFPVRAGAPLPLLSCPRQPASQPASQRGSGGFPSPAAGPGGQGGRPGPFPAGRDRTSGLGVVGASPGQGLSAGSLRPSSCWGERREGGRGGGEGGREGGRGGRERGRESQLPENPRGLGPAEGEARPAR
ncbi:uncharacterized protein RHO17_013077 [Thomomys bottae]